jgi:hypothetical protein
MILAYHVIVSAYGFWLPNDPRGSWSDFVRSWELLRFGRATMKQEWRSTASDAHDRRLRLAAKAALRYPPAAFTGVQAKAVAAGFADAVGATGAVLYACSILPEHVHFVAARHEYHVEILAGLLKGGATKSLLAAGLHPLPCVGGKPRPSPWERGSWRVYLDCEDEVRRAVRYVEDNPVKEGKRPQRWSFVRPIRW